MTERDTLAETSVRARWCLAVLLTGYLAVAVIAGVPNSPLTVLLPVGATPPGWAARLARNAGLVGMPRPGLIAVACLLMLAVVGAFVGVLSEAWASRVGLVAVLAASGGALAISVAAPLLLSRDVYTYAAYGRIDALYGHNPYQVPLSAFPDDRFVAAASKQWLPIHAPYGPVSTLADVAIARRWANSPGATILAFKLLAGAAIAAATACAALAAARVQPGRAALAAALVGLNPVLVVHTVGGGHIDAVIGALLAAAMVLATGRPRATSLRAMVVTALLTAAWLIKAPMLPALGLWMWWLVSTERARRSRSLWLHAGVIATIVTAAALPFAEGWHTLAALASVGGIEVWASPSHLLGHAARWVLSPFVGAAAGGLASGTVEVGFIGLFGILVLRLAQRVGAGRPGGPADTWGTALMLLALCMPYVLPWYAAWFLPLMAVAADEVLVLAAAVVSCVLALTLIPADPFYGYSTRAVMDGVHYGAASVLLVVLAVAISQVLRPGPIGGAAAPISRREGRRLGTTTIA